MDDDPVLARVVQAGTPAIDDIAAKVVRARVLSALFGKTEPTRIGRYELERQLGAGGGGTVYIARDPELSRKVALKLLGTRGRRDQMLAEAHALARLAHPNVVPIFDVGTHDDQIYLVMELVEGGTLRTWIESEPRTLRAVVRTYREAGAGLAAAHRAGFVHRDFKPDNALVGVDGRARVVDFGLVHVEGEARAGLGTPRYMPPEQAAGGEVTPAADQYSFCASLAEAVRARKDEHGARADSIPRWLDEILARGLSRVPADRYPSMEVLLDRLALDPAARWRRRAIVAGVALLGATAFVVGRAQSSLPDCDGGKDELAAVWSPAVRDAIAQKIAAHATPYSKQAQPLITNALDQYAQQWSAGHLAACQAHRRGTESEGLLDRRMRCLGAARAALDAAVNVVRKAGADKLPEAVVAATELPLIARCDDPPASTPPTPKQATEVIDIERALAIAEVDLRAGRTDVMHDIDALVARARRIAYAPVLAKALRLRGAAAIALESRNDALAPLDEAAALAFTAGDDELAIESLARRAWVEGTRGEGNPEAAIGAIGVVETIALRLPGSARATRALLANNLGSLELARGRRDRARAAFARALAMQSEVSGPAAVELAQIPGNIAIASDDPAERNAMFAQAIARLTTLVGKTHPTTLNVRVLAAMRMDDPDALEAACTDLVDLHPTHGKGLRDCAVELAFQATARDDAPAARRWYSALANAPGGDAAVAASARAHLLRLDGDPRAAAKVFADQRTALGEKREPWWRQLPMIEAELGRALAERDAGNADAARAALERARDMLVAVIADHATPSRKRRLAFVERALTAR